MKIETEGDVVVLDGIRFSRELLHQLVSEKNLPTAWFRIVKRESMATIEVMEPCRRDGCSRGLHWSRIEAPDGVLEP